MVKTRVLLKSLAMTGLALLLPSLGCAEGDAENGAKLAHTCLGCHGIPGYKNVYPTYRVPKLGGQPAAYLVIALQGYKNQTRGHDTMHAQAASMSQQDMEDIAAYFASFGEVRATADTPPRGEAPQAASACAACHSGNGISISPQFPNLAGQYESYLAQSLNQYRSGERQDAVMSGFASALSEEDVKTVAAFYATQTGLFITQ